MNAVHITKVNKSFGLVKAVDELSVTVPCACIYGFLGPNGAGKTTLIRMIMNIIRPDHGSISILGNSVPGQSKARIGYMPEERGLYRKMTVSKVLAYFGAIKGVSSDELARRIPKWLERIELANWADKKVEELSRGMHQKLQFVVTAINEPDLLILDEPFSGLDPLNLDLLKSIILQMRDEGKTVIFSTHIMGEVSLLSDDMALIHKGKLLFNGTYKDFQSKMREESLEEEFIKLIQEVQS